MRSLTVGWSWKKKSRPMTKPTKWQCAQRRLRSAWAIRLVWSESSLCTQWVHVAKEPRCLHADSEDSDQTGRKPRLIWVLAGRTSILLVLSWGGSNVFWEIFVKFDSDVYVPIFKYFGIEVLPNSSTELQKVIFLVNNLVYVHMQAYFLSAIHTQFKSSQEKTGNIRKKKLSSCFFPNDTD